MIDIEKSLCFTGHRPGKINGYDEDAKIVCDIKSKILDNVILSYDLGYRTFISGMALGVDIWAAEIVLGLRQKLEDIEFIAAIPFEGQEKSWPPKAVMRWKKVRKLADQVVIVCEGGYASWKMQKRNCWMVDNSSRVIAVWDGTNGGTANCVNYAERKGKTIMYINPNDFKELK